MHLRYGTTEPSAYVEVDSVWMVIRRMFQILPAVEEVGLLRAAQVLKCQLLPHGNCRPLPDRVRHQAGQDPRLPPLPSPAMTVEDLVSVSVAIRPHPVRRQQ